MRIDLRLVPALLGAWLVQGCGSHAANQPTMPDRSRTPSGDATGDEKHDAVGRPGAEGERLDPTGAGGSGDPIVDPYQRNDGPTTQADPNDPVVAPPPPPPPAAAGAWKGILVTGDYSINAFDNARKKLKELWSGMGVKPENLRELSMKEGKDGSDVKPTNRENIKSALASLSLGADDRCVVFLTSHGSRQGFYLADQQTLVPDELDQILAASCGDRPTVVLVSACYSGVFIASDAMKKPNRVILTAARPDRTSFGCGTENQYTFYDNCLIDHFKEGKTWNDLYTTVRACIDQKESGGGFTPSEPQGYFGANVTNYPVFAPPGP